jgi:hypothetical protein
MNRAKGGQCFANRIGGVGLLEKDKTCEYLAACTLIGLFEGIAHTAKEVQRVLESTCVKCKTKGSRKKTRKKVAKGA